jgi:cardiolipin synthase
MQLLIATARQRIWIANAYFVPSEPLLDLLGKKAKAGVDVRILAAGEKIDSRMYLPEQRARMARLIALGVKGYEYQPTMMHSKTVLVDDDLCAVGSLNLDALSLNKMEEATLVVRDREVAAVLERSFQNDLVKSVEVKLPRP